MSEEFLLKCFTDAAFPTVVAFYFLLRISNQLERMADSMDKLERRVERLEEKIFSKETSPS